MSFMLSGSSSSNSPAKTKSTPVGAIIGGIVGGGLSTPSLLSFSASAHTASTKSGTKNANTAIMCICGLCSLHSESFVQEEWSSPLLSSGLSYNFATSDGGLSGRTNFSARGYIGYPEPQQ
ncbi:hypothetical protein FRC08_017755 [Ceratobasidium sp. 394]|nr:hypothetical protein FRC08_017755 [Ceratobasidium sp. 394]